MSRMHNKIGGVAVASALSAATLLAGAAPAAYAHDSVIGGNPANGEVVSTFPHTIELEFSGQLQDGFNTVALSRDNGGATDVLVSGEPTVDGNRVSLDLPAGLDAAPGEYRVGFQIISSDGHATKGMTSFTYAPAGAADTDSAAATAGTAPAADATQNAPDTTADSNTTRWLFAVIGILAVAGAALAAVSRNRRAGQASISDKRDGEVTAAPRLDV